MTAQIIFNLLSNCRNSITKQVIGAKTGSCPTPGVVCSARITSLGPGNVPIAGKIFCPYKTVCKPARVSDIKVARPKNHKFVEGSSTQSGVGSNGCENCENGYCGFHHRIFQVDESVSDRRPRCCLPESPRVVGGKCASRQQLKGPQSLRSQTRTWLLWSCTISKPAMPIASSRPAPGSGTQDVAVRRPISYPPSWKAVTKSELSKTMSPLQSPSAQPATPAGLVLARLEDLHKVVAVKLTVEVSVAKPGVLEVIDPDTVVFQINAAVAVNVERSVRQPPRNRPTADLAREHIDISRTQSIVRVEVTHR